MNRRQFNLILLGGVFAPTVGSTLHLPSPGNGTDNVSSGCLEAAGPASSALADAASGNRKTDYFKHVFFDNSLTPDRYYYSEGSVAEPSRLRLDRGRIPVDTKIYFTPPNALCLQWRSMPDGGWEATLLLERWRNRDVSFKGDTLYFWCFSPESLPATHLPRVELSDTEGGFTAPLSLDHLTEDLAARQWVQVKLPLGKFRTASVDPFKPKRLAKVTFVQGAPDAADHTLIIDEVKIDYAAESGASLPVTPKQLRAKGYDRHIDLSWQAGSHEVQRYVIYRSFDGASYRPIGIQEPRTNRYTDFVGEQNRKAFYRIAASDHNYRESSLSAEVAASTRAFDDEELLTMLQQACFRYYWEAAHPIAGMALENVPGDENMVATGASGFGIMALIVGAERGFISHDQCAERMLKIVGFLEKADRFHGAWAHFMDGRTGKALPVFGKYDNGGDLVETAFLTQGLLVARQYFMGASEGERNLRRRITDLWESVEWNWYRRSPESDFLYWHWSPDYSWHMNFKIVGFNETMIVYLLSIASPTHSVPASMYYTGWASRSEEAARNRRGWGGTADGQYYANGNSYYGIKLDVGVGPGGPLFFAHYSYMGLDPRQVRDRYTDYFDNNRAIALINHAYCVANPGGYDGYGARCWGLTASDGPLGYVAHEPDPKMDDGTMTPTGALSSFPYTPDPSLQALKYFYRQLGDRLWGIYGFRDAFNLKENWFARIYMGLNQAPITVMIENYRSGLIWKHFMANPEIRPALERIKLISDAAGTYASPGETRA